MPFFPVCCMRFSFFFKVGQANPFPGFSICLPCDSPSVLTPLLEALHPPTLLSARGGAARHLE